MEKIKKLDFINLILILLLFMSFVSFDKNISSMKEAYKVMANILFGFTIARMFITKDLKIKNYKYLLVYCLLIVFSLFSIKWSIDTRYTIGTVKTMIIILLVVFSIIQYVGDSKEKIIKVFKMYIIFLLYMSFILIFFEKNEPGTSLYGEAVGLYFNSIAHMLAIGCFLSYYIFRKEKKSLYFVFILIFYCVIFLTGSRKGLLFPIISILGIEIFYRKISFKKIFKLITIFLVAIFIFTIILNANEKIQKRINDLFLSAIGQDVQDKSIKERRFYRETAKELFKENPLKGIGAGCFAAYMEQINYSHVAYSHNNYLELLSTLGILGFSIYYTNYVIILWISLKNAKKNRNIDIILPLVFIVIFTIFEYGIVSYYRFEYQPIICLFYLMAKLNEKELEEGK